MASIDEEHYLSLGSELTLDCRHSGEPVPNKKWFFNGREEWLQQRNLFADTEMDIPNLSKEHEGNYTCYVENSIGTDSVTHRVVVQGYFCTYKQIMLGKYFFNCIFIFYT